MLDCQRLDLLLLEGDRLIESSQASGFSNGIYLRFLMMAIRICCKFKFQY